jgi:hypothetical protein
VSSFLISRHLAGGYVLDALSQPFDLPGADAVS